MGKAQEDRSGEALSDLAVELEGLRAAGDLVALAERVEAAAAGSVDEADRALLEATRRSLRLEPFALGIFFAALGLWAVVFLLGVVLRHG
ncbi:MAG: hypothetical protein P1V51_11855 [Deltaproteobacteria bacterium]|nr:hypothetical protein [Deltaproteobacteria bacterium]